MEQLSFVQKIRRKARVKSAPEDIAKRIQVLADFYRAQKPGQKSITISRDDAWSIREAAKKDEKERTNEVAMAGFHVRGQDIEWRGFDLVELP
jgi:hypothetical protein